MKLISFSMFILSFFPLWVSILFIDIRSIYNNDLLIYTERISVLVLLLVNVLAFIIFFKEIYFCCQREGSNYYVLESVKEEKRITSEFLVSYMMPLCAFDFTRWDQVVLFLIYFITLSFLCIKHNYFTVNIILECFGYRFYKCELKDKDGIIINRIVISKRNLLALNGSDLAIRDINDDFVLNIDE